MEKGDRRMSYVCLKNVSKSFGSTLAIDNISLDIQEGKFTTLLGPSGCGKTTTLRIIAGIYSPDSGEVIIGGRRVNDIPSHLRDTAMVFQEYALFPHMNVYENVSYGLKRRKVPQREIDKKVQHILKLVGLEGYGNRSITQLSGGEQQRVALARALVVEPQVLLLDEPLSNLDAKLRIRVRSELREIQESIGKTTIYVTHDQEEALSISDTIVVMNAGKVIQVGSPQEVYYQPRDRFVADFVGIANFIEGSINHVSSEEILLDIGVGEILLKKKSPNKFQLAEKVTLVVRPEYIYFSKERESEKIGIFQGIIKASSFMGEIIRYRIQVKEMEWIVDMPSVNSAGYPLGSKIWVKIDPSKVHILPKE
ncbi:MAG TPA: ABC transporter ATP-binding protein [Candidatus Aerophobetes bacterium]|uniref:ABC transporter ATP-binding protein n=1 Tax=Aerophobetes bacterium TaxID=2030807 RepID=A0A7V0MZ50_UNCAE|nr:ABC transporter ATP-binding protein [Candidatus Aerophobetes bacterium]